MTLHLLAIDLDELLKFDLKSKKLIIQFNGINYPIECHCDIRFIALTAKKQNPELFTDLKYESVDYK